MHHDPCVIDTCITRIKDITNDLVQSALTVIDAALKQVAGLLESQDLVFAQKSVVDTISLFRPRRPGTDVWVGETQIEDWQQNDRREVLDDARGKEYVVVHQ